MLEEKRIRIRRLVEGVIAIIYSRGNKVVVNTR